MKPLTNRQSFAGHTSQAISSNSEMTIATLNDGEGGVADDSQKKRLASSGRKLPKTKKKPFDPSNSWILGVGALSTHPYPEFFVVTNASSRTILASTLFDSLDALIKILSELVFKHGRPHSIICDQHHFFFTSRLATWAAEANVEMSFVTARSQDQEAFRA
jgi:hypothetical protein